MYRPFGQLFLVLTASAAMLALIVGSNSLGAGGGKDGQDTKKDTAKTKDTAKDTGKTKDKIDPAKLKPDPAKVQIQRDKGEQHYKEILESETVPFHETTHFLIFGQIGPKQPINVGKDLERAYAVACKVLELEPNPGPWPGKLSVFLIHDAKRYAQAIRILQRRKADEDENGSYDLEGAAPHVVVCPSKLPGDLGMDATACTQMGACLISKRAKVRVPDWLGEGFGRATTLHVWPAKMLALDRRRAAAFVSMNNRNVGDIISNNLKAEELPVLRASLLDYLAYSGRTAKFLPIVDGFSDDAKGNPGSFNAGLANAKTTQADLNKNWQSYAKSFN